MSIMFRSKELRWQRNKGILNFWSPLNTVILRSDYPEHSENQSEWWQKILTSWKKTVWWECSVRMWVVGEKVVDPRRWGRKEPFCGKTEEKKERGVEIVRHSVSTKRKTSLDHKLGSKKYWMSKYLQTLCGSQTRRFWKLQLSPEQSCGTRSWGEGGSA